MDKQKNYSRSVKYIFSNARKERSVKKKLIKIFQQHGKALFEKTTENNENEETLSPLQKDLLLKERIILAHLSVICDDKELIESILKSSNSLITVQSENNWDSLSLLGIFLTPLFLYFTLFKNKGTAACFGSLEMFVWLLESKGGDIKKINKRNGYNCLHEAIYFSNIPIVQYILNNNILSLEKKVKNKRRSSCLDLSIIANNFSLYKFIYKHFTKVFGKNNSLVNTPDCNDNTPLLHAIKNSNLDIVKHLLSKSLFFFLLLFLFN